MPMGQGTTMSKAAALTVKSRGFRKGRSQKSVNARRVSRPNPAPMLKGMSALKGPDKGAG